MKKIFWTLFVLSITMTSFSQVKTVTLLNERVGTIHIKYEKITDLDKDTTIYMLWMGFQNARYSSITDIKSVAYYDNDSHLQFIQDLTKAIAQIESGEKASLSWDRKIYEISVRENSKDITLWAENARGYTWLSKKHAAKLIEQLNRITVEKDTVLPK